MSRTVTEQSRTITARLLCELLAYDPATGALTWKARPAEMFKGNGYEKRFNNAYAGKPALTTCHDKGYQYGMIFGQRVYAHRAAWAIMKGRMPRLDIDHINGQKDDNRIKNLRIVTKKGNGRNRQLSANNTSGISGVHWCRTARRWIAKIGKSQYVGAFVEKQDAIAARKAAERRMGYHENHGRKAA